MPRIHRWICFLLFTCLLSGCIEKEPIVTVPNAENLLFHQGRLFVTGSEGLWEVNLSENEFYLTPLSEQACEYTGMAVIQQWLFTACSGFWNGSLLIAVSLEDNREVIVSSLQGFFIPNGFASLDDGETLLIADENFFGGGGVSKATLEFSTGEPILVTLEHQWIGEQQNVAAANGVRIKNNQLYLTDLGSVKSVDISDPDYPSEATTLWEAPTFFDDLTPYCEGVLVTDFITGQLLYISDTGERLWQSSIGDFRAPSAVAVGHAPLFSSADILVTEKGGLTEPDSDYGNLLVSFDRDTAQLPDCATGN